MKIPTQQQINSLLECFHNKRFNDAEKLAVLITKEFPNYQFGWKILGVILLHSGRASESLAVLNKTLQLAPFDAETHFNLGVALKKLEKLEEAIESYTQATKLKPDYFEAYFNLGILFKEQRRLDKAIASFTKVMTLKPGFEGGYVNFLNIIKNIKFKSSNPNLYQPLIKILTVGNFTRPISIARPILSLLEHDDKIKEFLINKESSLSLKETLSIIANLNKLPLLYTLMRLCPLPDLKFETLFVAMRKTLLKNIDKMEATPELINFLSTLSINCFINEFIFIESKEETDLIDELQTKILKKFEQSEQPETIKILCLASYRPLHQYDWCQNIECFNDLKEVSTRLIKEPLAEKLISKDIPQLGRISEDVSLMVRKQYEENPYPRWMKLRIPLKSKSIATVCDELKLQLYSDKIKDVTAPTILIAGCGSGQQSIETAASFSNCHVTAVDLSMTSLAYARRKSNELSFSNLDYLQADILNLHQIKKEFDIIESVGVLHHMDEPMTGWKVLTDILKPGGLMRIGLYSELGRKEIVKARREIKSLEIGASANEIRNFRGSIIFSKSNNQIKLNTFTDFFSLSEFRDLVFHVQEHRFTIPQIQKCLDELGLKFCGFGNDVTLSNFRELHGHEADINNLNLWHEFEERFPQTFSGMYQFWCQKF